MTIKQQGGIFGRNPTFNDVSVDGTLTSSDVDIDGGAIDGITLGTNSKVTYATLQGDANRVNIEGGATTYVRLNAWSGSQDADARIVADRNLGSGSQSVLDFQVNNGTSLFTHSRCQTNGSFKIFDGNLVVASGHGIDFSATSGTGTSELFDDYEEGNFTATLTPETSGTVTIRSTEDLLSYTKIGRVVFVHGRLRIDSTSSPVGDYLTLSSLPFTSINGSESSGTSGSSSAFSTDGSDTFSSLPIYIPEGSSTAQVHGITLASINSNYRFDFSFSYIAA